MSRYSIGIYDRAGQYGSLVECEYLDMARVVREVLAARYPSKHVLVFDGERDGQVLTDDELEDAA